MKPTALGALSLIVILELPAIVAEGAGRENGPVTVDRSTASQLTVDGLIGPVRIDRDSLEIPQLRAGSDRDVYFAMGYIHASDRFFQMDYSRRLFSGTLAELMGQSALDSDIQLRTIGLRRAAEVSLPLYSGEALAILQAYSDGVNAWLNESQGNLPPEYGELEISQIQPWSLLDSVTVMKGIAFGLSFDLGDIDRTNDYEAYVEAGQEQGFDGKVLFSQDLFRSAPFDPSVSIPNWFVDSGQPAPAGNDPGPRPGVSRHLLSDYLDRVRRVPLLSRALEREEQSPGSNFWIIGPEHSSSGHPLFANDPHLSLETPAVFYEIHLTVTHDPAKGAMNVGGVSFPGVPGVVQGCNDRICWGSTVNPLDVTDVYEERLAIQLFPLRINGTLFEEQVEAVVAIPQTFHVNQAGDQTLDNLATADVGALEGGVTYVVPRRNMGPIVAIEQPNPENVFDVRGLSVQYTGWGPTREGETFIRLARARDLSDFKEALQYFDFGSQNWGYADVDGNIAYFTSGELPLREDLQSGALDGAQPWFVRDGTHEAQNEWIPVQTVGQRETLQSLDFAILPFDEMPQVVNPAQGFIANGNNDPVGVSLDNDVLNEARPGGGIFYLNPGFTSLRIGRIDQMIRAAIASRPEGLVLSDLQEMQADHVLLDGEVLVPHILQAMERASGEVAPDKLKLLSQDGGVQEAVNRLRSWSYRTPTGIRDGYDPGDQASDLPEPSAGEVEESVAATLFAVWRSSFVAATIDRTLEGLGLQEHRPDSERSVSALRNLLDHYEEQHGVGLSGIGFFHAEGIDDPGDARDYLVLRSLRDALDRLASPEFAAAFGQSTEQGDYRWGRLHRIRFGHVLGGAFDIPDAAGFSNLAAELPGLARSGGYETVDASAHSVRAAGPNGFMFGSGPARRFVAELNPAGIQAYQVIPGGESGRLDSPGYGSELGLWLTNQYHPLPLKSSVTPGDSPITLLPSAYRLFFPYYQGDAFSFTGFAVANFADSPADLEYRAWGESGAQADFEQNPSPLQLGGGTQVARLGNEIFGIPPEEAQSAWVELRSNFDSAPGQWPSLGSFFQVGRASGRVLGLDGSVAQFAPAKEFYFTRVYQGIQAADQAPVSTLLALSNPSPEDVTVTLQLLTPVASEEPSLLPAASQLSKETIRTIAGHGFLLETADDLFQTDATEGYVRVVASGAGVIGLELVQGNDESDFFALNPALPDGPRTLYSAQLAYGPSLDTIIKLINTSPFDRRVTPTAVRGGTLPDLAGEVIELAPGGAVELQASEIFSDQVSDGDYFTASLVVGSDGPGVVGDVVFGNFWSLRIAAALPLQIEPTRSSLFGHVANLPGQLFTGFALFNPGAEAGSATLTIFRADGSSFGEVTIPVGAGERLVRTLIELIPGLSEMTGGYVTVSSTVPLIGQELFGDFRLTLQSAVPPTIIE
jgi:penicillin amidase